MAGTVFSQTLINLLALAILAAVTFTSVPLHGQLAAILAVVAVPLALCALVLLGPRLLRSAHGRARYGCASPRSDRAPARPRPPGPGRVRDSAPRDRRRGRPAGRVDAAMARLLRGPTRARTAGQATLVAAAAILLAVNVSAILPATPSNVGVFQAACLVVLAAYGVGAGPALAYGIILQAVEVLTALALGIPALLGEGLTWQDIRPPARRTRIPRNLRS